MADASDILNGYFGETSHGIDEKRRVQIPSQWRSEQNSELFVTVWPMNPAGTCLRVMPPAKMAELLKTISAMPNNDPQKPSFKRLVGSQTNRVSLDKAGRLCLPEKMAAEAGLKDEAILVGMMDQFEIWAPARRTEVEKTDAALAGSVRNMMEV